MCGVHKEFRFHSLRKAWREETRDDLFARFIENLLPT